MEENVCFLDDLPNCFSSLVFLLLFLSHCVNAAPVFDQNAPPPTEENFDPAEADPRRNITCLGLPDLQLPNVNGIMNGFDPDRVTMQKLCAKPQYGGGRPNEHLGGYCLNPPNEQRTGEVAFDLSAPAQVNHHLLNDRLLLACSYRCFCNYGLADPYTQPKADQYSYPTSPRLSPLTYELQLDLNNDFLYPRALKMGKQGWSMVSSASFGTYPELSAPLPSPDHPQEPPTRPLYPGQYFFHPRHNYLSLDPSNEIECDGDLPTFILPSPYSTADFTSLQQMCATQPNGGKGAANAGGYCHPTPSSPTEPTTNTVWFSDSTTPRLDWTWAGGNFFASAAIRFHCWQRCRCKSNPSRDTATLAMWVIVQGHEMAYRSTGAMVLRATGAVAKGQQRETEVLPPQNGAGSASGTCGASGREFCPKQWDEGAWGAVPREPPGVSEVVKPPPGPKSADANATVCGNRCGSMADCGGGADAKGFGCGCALPSVGDAKTLGLDPVAPVAMCLVLYASTVVNGKLGGKRDVLGEGVENGSVVDERSGFPAFVDEGGVPHTCRCNETFTADACCEARDGIVYVQ